MKLIYHRYLQKYKEHFDTIEEALEFAAYQMNAGEISANSIEDDDGNVMYDFSSMHGEEVLYQYMEKASNT